MNDSPTPSRWLRGLSLAAAALWWLLVALWLALALAWGALHGWIVPRVDEWRPTLEREASRVLGVPVRIGAVSARSDALMPSFELSEVVLLDAQAREALRLPRVVVALSPRSLLDLGFEQLYIERPELEVRRDTAGRLWVAGLEVTRGGGEEGQAADWFFRQKEVVVLGGTLRWIDELRAAPPLALTDLRFVARNGARSHALRLDARPPADWGDTLTLMGQMRSPLLSQHPGRWEDWQGELYADVGAIDLARLSPYADLGVELRSGQGRVRAWADLDRGRLAGGQADVDLRRVDALLVAGKPPLALASVAGSFAGKLTGKGLGEGLGEGFELATRDLQFETADGQRWPGGNLALTWEPATARSPEKGRLRADRLDLQALARLAERLPLPEAQRAHLARLPQGADGPAGLIERLEASWEGSAEAISKYKVSGRASGLTLPADAASQRPGLRGLTVEGDFDEAGGKARVEVAQGVLDLPGLLAEPRVVVDRLAADLQWKRADGRVSVGATGIRVANADLQAEGQASWRSADPARGGPGLLDLQMTIARIEGNRVWRYLPLQVHPNARDYVRDAIATGQAYDGRVRVRGDLHDFPFANSKSGEFRISAKLRNVQYAFVPRGPGAASASGQAPAAKPAGVWAPLSGLSGELVFDRASLQVRKAQGRFAGSPGLQVQAEAAIPNLAEPVVGVTGTVRGPLAEALAVFNASPVAASLGQPLAQVSASGAAEVKLQLSLPLASLPRSTVQGSVALAGNDLAFPGAPPLSRVRGTVGFNERGFTLSGVQARALGGDLRAEGGTRNPAPPAGEAHTQLRIQGQASAEGLRQAQNLGPVPRLARQAIGSTPYSVVVGIKPAGADISVTSNLQGLALSLPAPLNKAADAALPLRFDLSHAGTPSRPLDQLRLDLGRVGNFQYLRDLSGAEPVVLRGAIGIGLAPGETVTLPEQGVAANLLLVGINLDDWEQALAAPATTAPPATGSAARALGTPALQAYLPSQFSLRARELTISGRTINNFAATGSRDGLTWRAQVEASQVQGQVEYRQPAPGAAAAAGNGRIVARLSRLAIPATATGEVEALLDQQTASMPAIDVVVEDFELRGKKLGRLEMEAANRASTTGAGTEWRLARLALSMPEATLNANGTWSAASPPPAPAARGAARPSAERRRTTMNFRLDVNDGGQLLTRLGMKDLVRRGRGKLEGQIAWQGSPLGLDYPSLSGAFNVNIESGQFLKADPGLAKLLGVLSLQSLPRRLTLDFRDVFSEGFAFDFLRGDVTIAQGIAATNNLQMKGVNAAVLMDGRADIARETQDIRVVVVPEINAGTASVVAGVINPAVGLGSFLAQLFLRQPLMKAATQEFHVDGTWSDPRVTKVTRSGNGAAPAASGGN